MRSRRWKFAASLGLLLCLSASIAVGGFAADASVAEQGYPGGGDWGRPSQAYGYAPDDSVLAPDGHYYYPNSWTTVSEATCINKEKQVRYCVWQEWDWRSWRYVQCNYADYREVGEVDPNNHVNTITINEKKATCTEEGYTGDLYCKDCRTTIQTGSSIPAKGHKWGQWTTTKKATCTEAGIETHECRKCGKTEERETKVLGHDWDNGVVTTPATCTEDGVKTYTCKRDASHTKQETIPKTEHTPVPVPAKAATCTETGLTEGSKCQTCGVTLVKQEVTPALDHDWDNGVVTTPATCTKDGVKTYTCKRDASHTKQETIPKTEHTPVPVPAKAATCTETGLTEGSKCQTCGVTLVEQKETPALDHDYQLKDHKDATCTEAGYDYYECSRDASHHYTETIAKTGHDYTEKVVSPTCESDGYTIFTCNNCGDIYTGNVTEKLGHDYQLKDHKDATCTEAGYDYYECSRDASHHYTETIAKTGHDYTEKVVSPTCESDGYTIFTCNNCGDIYTGNVTAKLGHDYQLKDHKDATCTEAGYDYYECSRDALHNYTEAIPATDHMYGKEVVEPTCTEPGYTKYTCAYCGDSYTTDEKPVLGHEEVVISGQNPTCEAEGWTESSYCKRCNVTLKAKEIIPAQGHDPIAVPGKEPTCTETGLTEGSKCQRCGKTLTAQETIPALGHDWNTTSTGVDNCVNVSFRHENETITLCPICGVQNGTQRLNKVTLYTAHAKLVVLRGVLENGMEAMTVAFYEPGISSVTACQRCGAVRDSFSSGASLPQAAENAHFTVDASLVDGYTVMLVQADGTETVLTPGISNGKAIFDVDMKGQGARLLHLVPTTAA